MEKVAVVGMSMGGEEAIGAIGADQRIAAVIAEGATARTDLDKGWPAKSMGLEGGFSRIGVAAVRVHGLAHGCTQAADSGRNSPSRPASTGPADRRR